MGESSEKATGKVNDKPFLKAKRDPYRKVKVKMWSSPKFQALSALPPSGQSLFIYLLTGPFTSAIPGLFKGGRAAMAEELGWEQEAFDEALNEALTMGIVEVDLKARLVWIPEAIHDNPPESPNVVKSWAKPFENLPDCALKIKAWNSLRAASYAVSESFGMAFDKAIVKPSDMALLKSCGNQENRRTGEQERIKNKNLLPGAEKNQPPTEGDGCEFSEGEPVEEIPAMPEVFIALPLNDNSEYPISTEYLAELNGLYPAIDVEQELRNQRGWLLSNPKNRKTKSGIKRFITAWLAKAQNSAGRVGASNSNIDFEGSFYRLILQGGEPQNRAEAIAQKQAQSAGLKRRNEVQAHSAWRGYLSQAYKETGEQPYTGG
ncbi:hypothetical protein [Serratia fonticola]|uniref:hypothetical protein n=1 Tax=Serratia fonticola TaxID=47917 RepID=UPI0021790F65|nr:hypothetical protein [Serratia fonticola]CAI1687960.1 Uncharacterised protein [Serratia fonticola]